MRFDDAIGKLADPDPAVRLAGLAHLEWERETMVDDTGDWVFKIMSDDEREAAFSPHYALLQRLAKDDPDPEVRASAAALYAKL
jgi:hypothetical protein